MSTIATSEALNLLPLYRDSGLWCFDHPALQIEKEPFVEGIDTIIDTIADIDCPSHGDRLVLDWSVERPKRHSLVWICRLDRPDGVWNRYELYSVGRPALRGNLCPVLGKFFGATPPPVINFVIYDPEQATEPLWDRAVAATLAPPHH
jgi:hypothetical protein